MSYEENIQNYKDSISNILTEQLASSAQKIAEGGELGEEARQATAQIVGPLALDMLKEGIMHKAGVASARIGAGKNVRDQINEAFKTQFKKLTDRATDAAKAKGEELLAKGRGKLQDIVDQARGKATAAVQEGQDALTSAVGTARQAAQATGDRLASQARDALEQGANVRDLATSAVQDGVAQVRGAQGGFTSGRAPASVPPQNNEDTIIAQGARANDPQQIAQDTLDRYKGHVDEKVAELRSKLTDPSQKVVIAGKEGEGTNIGSERAVGQWQTFSNEQGIPNVGPQVRQYTNDQLNQLKADFPDQVSFGRIKPSDQIPADEIHVWGANTANANIPNGEVFPAAVSGGQAAVIGKGSPNEMGIVSTPLTGIPDVKPSGAPQVASTTGEAPALRYDPRASIRANFEERLNAFSAADKAEFKTAYKAGRTNAQPNETPEQKTARIASNNKLADDLITAKENANSASEANNPTSNQLRDSLAPMREMMAQTQSKKPVTQQDVPEGAGGGASAETNIDNLGSRPSTLDASKFTVAPQDEPKTSAPPPTEEAPSFFSTANIAERSGDALGGLAAGIGAAYAISRPDMTAGQRATTAVEAAAPLVAEKAIGDVIPGAGLIVSGIEDAATPNLGSATQRAEDFGVQTGVLAAQKVGFKAGQALQRTIQARRAGQTSQAAEGEEGTELTDLSTVGTGETAAGETAGATAETVAGTTATTETAAATGGGLAAELGTDAAAAAAAGPESGGLGFIAAGVIGLGAVLASIFAPHHHEAPKAGPPPNLAIPVQSVGLR